MKSSSKLKVGAVRIATIVAVACLGVAGYRFCSNMAEESSKPVLHLYNWSDYVDPSLIEQFERDNGCRVVTDTFDDNETMLAKMVSGATGYDVIFPSSYVIPVLRRRGLIRELDMSLLPNVTANFDGRYATVLHEDSFRYSVPYAFSMVGIAYRTDKVELTEDEKAGRFSWNFLLGKGLANRMSVMNDIREMLGIGLRINGFSNNSTNDAELAKACDTAIRFKRFARTMDNVEYRVSLASGSLWACVAYCCDIFQVIQENPDIPIAFVVPQEGSNSCWDEMCIPSTSKHPELAHKFINFLYEGESAAKNIVHAGATMPNKAWFELLDDDLRNNPMICVPKETLERVELVRDLGDAVSLYNKWWDVFMAAR